MFLNQKGPALSECSESKGFIPIIIAIIVALFLGTGLFILNKTMPGGLASFKIGSISKTQTPKEGFGQQLTTPKTTTPANQTTTIQPQTTTPQQTRQAITYTQPFTQTQMQTQTPPPAPTPTTIQDTTPPTITFIGGPSGTISSNSFCFTFAPFSDNVSSWQDISGSYKIDVTNWTDWQPSSNLAAVCFSNMADGQHTFHIRVKDKAGNINEQLRTFTIKTVSASPTDTIPPTITLTSMSTQVPYSPCFYFSVTDNTSPLSDITFSSRLDTADWPGWGSSNTLAFCFNNVSNGQHTVYLRAKDKAGNIGEQGYIFTITSVNPSPTNAETFRDQIFSNYGFTSSAIDFIRTNSRIEVKNLNGDCGGGGWYPGNQTVILECAQHEAAVHELSHVWWHKKRIQYPQTKKELARDVIKLADFDAFGSTEYRDVVAFAKNYVYGGPSWSGMYCNNNQCVADVHNITDADFGPDWGDGSQSKVNDWEIYAGFSSYTMGKFKDGPRKLPQFMWKYFEQEFTGNISVTPYYQGGHN